MDFSGKLRVSHIGGSRLKDRTSVFRIAMARLDLRHFFEELGGGGIALAQILGEHRIDAIVLLFGGDRHGENFAFGESEKRFTRLASGFRLETI
jgi:hypothetical protein